MRSIYLSLDFARFCLQRIRGALPAGYQDGLLPGAGIFFGYVFVVVRFWDTVAVPAESWLAMGQYGVSTGFVLGRTSAALPAVLAFAAALGALQRVRDADGDRRRRLRAIISTVLTPLCLGVLAGAVVGVGFIAVGSTDGLDGAVSGVLLFGLSLYAALEHAFVVLPFLSVGAVGAVAVDVVLAFARR